MVEVRMQTEHYRKNKEEYWISRYKHYDAYWFHDGNPQRPYAELSGGKYSNFYADSTDLVSRPGELLFLGQDLLEYSKGHEKPHAFNGSAYGAIALATELARQAHVEQAWYTAKGSTRGHMVLDRFNFSDTIKTVVLVEDVISEFTTTRASIRAIESKRDATGHEGRILPYVLCIVNRSGHDEIEGYKIISLINEKRAKVWAPGGNPFVHMGGELVPPLRPKQHWTELTRAY
jgi:orotate phosphoribosyltransferase